MSGEPQDEQGYDSLEFYTTARVTGRASSESLLKKAKDTAPDPSVFDEEGRAPFFWEAQISTDEIDSYFTRMDEGTLRNYAADVESGVSFMNSHNIYQMPMGRSLEGKYTRGSGDNLSRVDASFYTLRGTPETDHFIDLTRAGIQKDVSVGFKPGYFKCNLCEGDPFNWWTGTCMHIPGLKYDKDGNSKRLARLIQDDEQGRAQLATLTYDEVRATRKKKDSDAGFELCFAWVMDGHLREVSAVYKGATPSAHITKIRMLALQGELDEDTILQGERLYRIQVPRRVLVPVGGGRMEERVVHAGRFILSNENRSEDAREQDPAPNVVVDAEETPQAPPSPPAPVEEAAAPAAPENTDNLKREESTEGVEATTGGISSAAHAAPEDLRMSGEEQNGNAIDLSAQIRTALAKHGIQADADPMVTLDRVLGEITVLRPRAEMGDTYFNDMVEETIKRGISAFGDDFDETGHRAILTSYPRSDGGLKMVKQMLGSFDAIASKRFPGGRQTTEHDNETPEARAAGTNGAVEKAKPSEIAQLSTFRS